MSYYLNIKISEMKRAMKKFLITFNEMKIFSW